MGVAVGDFSQTTIGRFQVVYLIARGTGMQKRSYEQAMRVREQQDSYIRATAGSAASATDEIAKGKALLDAGTITQGEFEAIKAKSLA